MPNRAKLTPRNPLQGKAKYVSLAIGHVGTVDGVQFTRRNPINGGEVGETPTEASTFNIAVQTSAFGFTVDVSNLTEDYAAENTYFPDFVADYQEGYYVATLEPETFDTMHVYTGPAVQTYRDADGEVVIAGAGPRHDAYYYDPTTPAWKPYGLYIETVSGENIWPHWRNLSNFSRKQNATVLGTTVTATAGTGINRVGHNIGGVAGASVHQFELGYLGSQRYVQYSDNVNPENSVNFDIVTGQIGRLGSNTTAFVAPLANGNFACFVLFDDAVPISGDMNWYFIPSLTSDYEQLQETLGGEEYMLTNIDVKLGKVFTSLVPTTGSAQTRVAETLRYADAIHPADRVGIRMEGVVSYSDDALAQQLVFFRSNDPLNEVKMSLRTSTGSGQFVASAKTSEAASTSANVLLAGSNRDFRFFVEYADIMQFTNNGSSIANGQAQGLFPSLNDDAFLLVPENFVGGISKVVMWGEDITTTGKVNQGRLVAQAAYPTLPLEPATNAASGDQSITYTFANPLGLQAFLIYSSDGPYTVQLAIGTGTEYTLDELQDDEQVFANVALLNGVGLSRLGTPVVQNTAGLPYQMDPPTSVTPTADGFIIAFDDVSGNGLPDLDWVAELTQVTT